MTRSTNFCELYQLFNLEAKLQANGVIESIVKEVIKKQLRNAAKRKGGEQMQMMQMIGLIRPILASIYLLKVINRNSRTRCEICSKLEIIIPERRQWRRSGIFIVNFEYVSHLVLVFLLLTLGR